MYSKPTHERIVVLYHDNLERTVYQYHSSTDEQPLEKCRWVSERQRGLEEIPLRELVERFLGDAF